MPSGEIRGQIQGATLEAMTPDDLAELNINIVNKVKVTNLPSLGYLPSDKPEGLAILDDGSLAVLNDNDFGLEEGAEAVQVGIIDFEISSAFDPSDRDDGINIKNWPVYGMFMPDSIASYTANGMDYYVFANEGDDRGDADEPGIGDAIRVKDLGDVISFGRSGLELGEEFDPILEEDENLGRLTISSIDGDLNGDGKLNRLQSYGTRSFSIIDKNGNLVFDSGADFENIIAEDLAPFFNSNNDDNDSFESRSDNKGPEPEGITVGTIDGETYAFIGLERIGGVMIYNITNPTNPEFVQYLNNRNFVDENGQFIDVEIDDGVTNPDTKDLGPEGLIFIPSEDSPNGKPLLVVANEVSGTTTIYELDGVEPELPEVVFCTPDDDNFDSAFPDDKQFVGQEQILFTGGGDDYVDVSLVGRRNRINTGSGNDIVFAGNRNRIILGAGDDILFAGAGRGANRISLGAGEDKLWLTEDDNTIPRNPNRVSDFSSDEDMIGFANTVLSLGNKGDLWDYEQVDRIYVQLSGFEMRCDRFYRVGNCGGKFFL